jgi:hypothetical protein
MADWKTRALRIKPWKRGAEPLPSPEDTVTVEEAEKKLAELRKKLSHENGDEDFGWRGV